MNQKMIEQAEREAEQEMAYQYSQYCAEQVDDEALPPHKRTGYWEMMYERADDMRRAKQEEELLQSINAQAWAISTGAKA